uniref:Triacylglycerol lipase n=1 Tax=Macrostomum lignano TaxID=282301 RepID=A0A1I8JHV6_9PLAT
MKLLLIALVACFVGASVADHQHERDAINYLTGRIPELRSKHSPSGSAWTSAMYKIVRELDESAEFRDILAAKPEKLEAEPLADSAPFSCQLDRSPSRPTSVHRLRPGDIDVIGAMGDSLTAANGALATSILGLLTEYRGYAWSIGGQVSLSKHTTIANVLRHQNSNLYGHSTGSGKVSSSNSVLNVAEPGKVASDMPGQAKELVRRLQSDSNVNFNKDWKLITLFIGGNDVCDYCKDKNEFSADNYIRYIREALDYLHANVPRAFVNVAEVLDVSLVKDLKDGSSICRVLQGSFLCKCGAMPENEAEEREIQAIIGEYQARLRQLVDSGRYDTREDFTVVTQPFFRNSKPPKINGKYDQSYFAPDCFHFSRKGHDESAKALWNNMIEPVGQKSTSWTPNGPFKCPTSVLERVQSRLELLIRDRLRVQSRLVGLPFCCHHLVSHFLRRLPAGTVRCQLFVFDKCSKSVRDCGCSRRSRVFLKRCVCLATKTTSRKLWGSKRRLKLGNVNVDSRLWDGGESNNEAGGTENAIFACTALGDAELSRIHHRVDHQHERDAINYLTGRIPELRSKHSPSGSAWTSAMYKIVRELDESAEFRDILAAKPEKLEAEPLADSAPFSCQLDRSPSRPTSVHRLRPGDIDVIGAMGDSLTAANGALATSILGLLTEYRGYAWSIGGQVSLSQHTTLANVLRQSNNNLYGHSTGSGSVHNRNSVLNVAVPGNVASHMPGQAKLLVSKLQSDPNVNFNNDWKLITLFIGGNDVCNYCKDKAREIYILWREFSADNYIKHIREALDYLHANVPKAFVNVAELLDVSLVKELKDGSSICNVLQGSLLCRCGAFPENEAEEREVQAIIGEYQSRLRQLVDSGRYDTREDFTVVNQPFFKNSKPPKINGKYDQSYFAPDCFHFSRKGHDESAKALWNNMIEPVGQKSTSWTPGGPFKCPTSARPYLSTRKN